MSLKLTESVHEEDAVDKLDNTTEKLETYDIINGNYDMTRVNIAQLSVGEKKCETKDKLITDSHVTDNRLSENDEEDDWDRFEIEKLNEKDNLQGSKGSKKDLKEQKRHKSMVRYTTSSTAEFDEQTKFLLRRLVAARFINHYFHIIGTGRKSIVIYGKSSSLMSMPTQVVIKVYEDSKNSKALYKRVQNEYKSLDRMYRCRINAPKPVCAWRNIIVMGTVGYGKTAASIITAPPVYHYRNYLEIVESLKKMYQIAKIVHGNLSHRCILWFDQPYFISLSRSVSVDHPKALKLLIRDCYCVTNLYEDKQLPGIKTTEELFKFVTELPEIDSKLLEFLRQLKPSDFKSDIINYNSKHSTVRSSVNYEHVLEYCAKLHR